MSYTWIKNQPSRLGEFGQGGGSEYITAVGNVVTGVVQSVGATKVAVTQAKTGRDIAITESKESTKKLGLQTGSQTEQARIAADQAKMKYKTIPFVILVSGATLVAAIAVAAWGYNKMVGEYEIEYE